ncbi:MAG TPA: HAMP domain-containing sensor histidine kinase, partial [Anaerolineae bacterium]
QEPVDLEYLASEVVRQLQVIAGGVKVSLQIGPGEPVSVVGDPDRLRQLVLNLVDNAIKYTLPGGEAKVRVQCEGDRGRLDVSDTGPGISPEHLKPGPGGVPLIFERFYRAEKSRSRAAGTANGNGRPGSGTGLGLSIAHWIVQAHSGQIDVQSEMGKGTTFTVWLPLYPSLVQPVKLTLL